MRISEKDWINFKDRLASISQKAADLMTEFVEKNGGYQNIPVDEVIEYANALAQKYGEAAGTWAALMYDAIAELSNANVEPAEVADTATYSEVAKAVQGAAKFSHEAAVIGAAVGRLVKMTGQDTMVKNAIRDRAMIAWVPMGDTCAYCLMLAAEGWKRASKDALQDGHSKHIHGNCDCSYSVRFDEDTQVGGYNPNRYMRMYSAADGTTQEEKLNAMRREFYAENSEEINAQKRSAYEKRKERKSSSAEELNI